jgi:hypothetical protein
MRVSDGVDYGGKPGKVSGGIDRYEPASDARSSLAKALVDVAGNRLGPFGPRGCRIA